MFKNHLKIAWRSLKNQPFFTGLNIFGLAIGLTGALLITIYIYDEFSYDKMFTDANRIHRINADVKFGGEAREFAEVSAPMAAAIKNDIPQVEMTTRFRNRYSMLIRKSDVTDNVKESNATFVDDTFFTMFDLSLLHGDVKTALKEPNTMVLTKTAAEKHFSLNNAIGQKMILSNTDTYTVTGIIEDLPKNSFLKDHHIFMAMSGWEESRDDEWGSHDFPTFVKLIPSAKIEDVQIGIDKMFEQYVIPYAQETFPGITAEQFLASGNYLRYNTIPLTDIHLKSHRYPEFSENGDIQDVYILSFLALFLMVLACVNFMNLSTAYSLKRAKEVGVRKTLGSGKRELVQQFLSESGLITFFSLLFAVVISFIAMPFFNQLADKEMSIPFLNPVFWMVLLSATLLIGLLAGIYPAFFMSRFMPVKVLKGGGNKSAGGSGLRSSLVVFQFAISIFLIISTIVVFQQLDFIQNKDLGYSKEKIVLVDNVYSAGDKAKNFKEEIQQLAFVENATLTGYLPTESYRRDNSYFLEGKMEQEHAIQMQSWTVDYDYLKTMNLKLVAGRDFDQSIVTDSLGLIVNEAALKIMNVSPEEAIGLRITRPTDDDGVVFTTIVGVVKDFHFETLKKNIRGLSMQIGESRGSLAIKLQIDNLSTSLAQIENIWNKLAPGQPFDYTFMDEAFNTTYKAEKKLGQIFIVFTILSILIACLGLFGLAAFNAEKRKKEIGVRKVLGASVGQISYRLTVDFLKLVFIGILISIPLGWFAMDRWLQDFSYRIEIAWWVFGLAALMAIGIAIATVSYQSIKAAIVNPVKSLRSE
ncbi:ABC transporter permease [Aurantibacter crassamenti]|uniref:FtsX-like permease family protein n=1 Tax=Aurantibacter crassamenti TaxID=1837375 RepID=UPI001939F5BD|nr:FtsX-like permease family protein [Aurantibacter crassamenti]MBM1106516.1 ABC transporter permease [Aurantibacter crassamenti]